MPNRQKYAIVGSGGRSAIYIHALAADFKEQSELVAFCDISQTRMDYYNQRLETKFDHHRVPTYLANDFDKMIAETHPNVVMVISVDSTHDRYIIRAMELGCDVISEKPLTTDAVKLRAIFDAIKRTGRKLKITLNMRYVPAAAKVCQLLREGVIGQLTAAELSWLLDTSHGADYFRRWHREKDKSGGLLIHKATHHFDIINWWVRSYPATVFGMGSLKFYGRENAEARGETHRTSYARYTGEAAAKNDPFALRLDSSPDLKGLYLDAETDSGYLRDRNVFGDNITAEDTMAVMARYRNGVVLNYSLVCYSPWEGWNAALTGTRGRMEVKARYGSHIITGPGEVAPDAMIDEQQEYQIVVRPMFGRPYTVEVPPMPGSHGGSDQLLFQQLFNPVQSGTDLLGQAADHIDGAAAILMGISANQSMATGLPVDCDSLLELPEHPHRI